MTADTSNRRYELDWLRVWAILIVFLYHSTRFFNLGDWHVKNVDTYIWVEMWNLFAVSWMMPLFFIISGVSLFHAIGKSSGWRRFYTDKFQRLMIPVLIGSVTHGVLQVYLERYTHGQFSGSFFSFFPEYFNGIYWGIDTPGNFAFHGMHLWYLLFLFLYGLVCYRLFSWLREWGREIPEWIATMLTAPGLIYVWFSIPLLIMKVLIPAAVLDVGSGGWGFLFYLWFLITGFLIGSSDRLQQRIESQRWTSLSLGVMLSAAHLCLSFGPSLEVLSAGMNDWIRPLLFGLSAWCWLFAILGTGLRFLAFDHRWLRHANEGVLPFFILHQPVLLGIGYFIVNWEIHDALKWAIISASAFIVIVMLYALLIRRLELFRFLFGMKSAHSLSDTFQKGWPLTSLHVLYVGLIVLAVVCQITGASPSRSPMPLTYEPKTDTILSSDSITDHSSTGIHLVEDNEASIGRAMVFTSGANPSVESNPMVYVDMRFSAPAGRYMIWLRGRTDSNSDQTDSVWLQVDEQIGTAKGTRPLGNWLDIHPAGVYGWAGNLDAPIAIELKRTGSHVIRFQPRQTPHRIDQIWLSRSQLRVPNTLEPIR